MPLLVRRTRRRPRGRPGRRHRRWRRRSAPRRRRGSTARAWPGPAAEAACSRVATAAASRASLLIRLISVSQSRAAASSASGSVAVADGRPEAALGRFLGRVDRARIGPRGRVEGGRLVRVVRALGGAQGFRRGIGLAAGTRRELAAFGGQSPLLGAAFGRVGCRAHRRPDLVLRRTHPQRAPSGRPGASGWIARRGRDARQGKGGLHDPPGDRRVACRFDRDGAGHRRDRPDRTDGPLVGVPGPAGPTATAPPAVA